MRSSANASADALAMPSAVSPLIKALLDAEAYPHAVERVELIQTHISYVLLAGEFAYKIKKPVDFGFVDYTSLGRRRHFCEEEVRLNRRLCDDIYLGVVPIVSDGGRYRIAVPGDAVEYAVQMRRVPPGRMMPALLERGSITPRHIRLVARTMARFHASSETNDAIAAFGRVDTVRRNWEENFDQTAVAVGGPVQREQYDAVRTYVDRFLTQHAPLFEERASAGRVRDCHGDLRADAIVVGEDDAICVMDCIEFNDRLRYGDVASDIAFLAMDLDYRGHSGLALEFAAAYLSETNDETMPFVWNFYCCYRAYVRAKVECLLLTEPETAEADRTAAAERAHRYAARAQRYTTEASPQVLVAMIGLSGTGKSHIAGALSTQLGAVILRSDAIRKERMGLDLTAPMREEPDTGAYTPRARADVYGAMHDRARAHFSLGRSVILDATYISRANRDAARILAAEAGVPLLAVEVTADEWLVRSQLAQREEVRGGASDAGWSVYLRQRRQFEVPDEIPPHERIRIDASRPLEENIRRITDAVRARLTEG